MPEGQTHQHHDPVAVLEHLTGPSRGQITWLTGGVVRVGVGDDRLLHVAQDEAQSQETPLAVMHWDGASYSITVRAGRNIWINGKKQASGRLNHGDVVEFGETGPMSRFRLVETRRPLHWSLEDMFGDTLAYIRSSRRPLGRRLAWAAGDLGRRVSSETTIAFRIMVVAALIVLGAVTYSQFQKTAELRETVALEADQLADIARDLARTREEALRPSDLTALRTDLREQVSQTVQRLEALESEAGATPRIIAQSYASVAFLQGAYGLRHTEDGKMLRHVLSPDGLPVMSPFGQPLLSLDGDGPIAEVQFTGTAFLIGESGVMVSNRHVAMPWESRTDPERLEARSLAPALIRFVAYLPGHPDPFDVTVRQVSETADLVTLQLARLPDDPTGLEMTDTAPRPGDAVIVMGYPTGLRSMLAQSGSAFLEDLQETDDTNFWSVAERLSQSGLIAPLASRGIVGQASPEAVVYDAETTHGGSGGPVLDMTGKVVAINSAILPEYGGSNLGIPVTKLRALLARNAAR